MELVETYRFALETNKLPAKDNRGQIKHYCPQCGKKRFVRYVDVETLEYLPEHFGRCDREESCGYHLPPGKDQISRKAPIKTPKKSKSKPSFTKPETVRKSLTYDRGNNLIYFLLETFGDKAWKAIKKYRIGTDYFKMKGAPIFWQIDKKGKVRGGKIIQYNPETGKRIKGRESWNHWVNGHEPFGKDYNLYQCLFGEHLLRENPDIVCVVESEKTALIASIVYPQYAWMATGGLNQQPLEKCQALIGYRTILIPDVGCYDKWKAVANELNEFPGADFSVFDYLEQTANEAEGYDIADFLTETQKNVPPQENNESEWFTASTGVEVCDPTGLLWASGLDFLCDPELERQWDKALTNSEQNFEVMKAKNPKVGKLKDRLGLQID